MSLTATTLEIEQEGDILILKPAMDALDLGETKAMAMELRELIGHTDAQGVILDLHGARPFDSEAQRLAVELWQAVRSNGGSMAICF